MLPSDKRDCLKWFDEVINSNYGALAESFLTSFTFPNSQKHTMISFTDLIINDSFKSVNEMISAFKLEIQTILSIIDCTTNAGKYIHGFFKELIEKMDFDFCQNKRSIPDFDLQNQLNFFNQSLQQLPNDIESFYGARIKDNLPVPCKITSIYPSDWTKTASMKDIEELNERLKDLPVDHNSTDIADIITFFENLHFNSNDDDEVFQYDLTKLSQKTLNKIKQYLDEQIPNEFPNRTTRAMTKIYHAPEDF